MPLCLVSDGPIIIMLSHVWLHNGIQSHAHAKFTFCPLGKSFDKPNTDLPSKPLPNIFFHLFLVRLLPVNFNGIYLGWPCVLPAELNTFLWIIFCPRVTRVPETESSLLLMKTLAIIQLITDSHRTIDCSEGFDIQCEDAVEESAYLDWENTVRVWWYTQRVRSSYLFPRNGKGVCNVPIAGRITMHWRLEERDTKLDSRELGFGDT